MKPKATNSPDPYVAIMADGQHLCFPATNVPTWATDGRYPTRLNDHHQALPIRRKTLLGGQDPSLVANGSYTNLFRAMSPPGSHSQQLVRADWREQSLNACNPKAATSADATDCRMCS
jgi:hypothetical protein